MRGVPEFDLYTAKHSAAVRRDVLEVVEGRACVKFHLLPVTAVSLRAIVESDASKFN